MLVLKAMASLAVGSPLLRIVKVCIGYASIAIYCSSRQPSCVCEIMLHGDQFPLHVVYLRAIAYLVFGADLLELISQIQFSHRLSVPSACYYVVYALRAIVHSVFASRIVWLAARMKIIAGIASSVAVGHSMVIMPFGQYLTYYLTQNSSMIHLAAYRSYRALVASSLRGARPFSRS